MYLSGTYTSTVSSNLVRDLEGLRDLAKPWDKLAGRFPTPLLSHEWFVACTESFCPPGELSIVVVNDGGTVRAIAPCVWIQSISGGRLEILGSSIHHEPTGMLYDTVQSLGTLFRMLVAQRRPLRLMRMPKDAAVDDLLRMTCWENDCVLFSHASSSPWLPLESDWSEFESGMSSSRRNSLKRCRKRAAQHGEVVANVYAVSPNEVEEHFQTVARVEAAGWKGKKGSAIAQMPQLEKFFSRYGGSMAKQRKFLIGVLQIGGYPVAVLAAVSHANRFWLLKTGYDESWSRSSPGILLLHESIRWAFEHGFEAYEFLGYDEPWIHMWTEHLHHYVTYYIYPRSLTGVAGLVTDAASVVGRKVSSMKWGVS